MPENRNVTSANAEFILACEELFPQGIALEMFGTDAAFAADNVDVTENRRGIDGKMVSGVIKNVYPVTITLEASSPSAPYLFMVRDAMQANNRPYAITLTVNYPALGQTRTYINGALRNAPTMASAQRTLQPTTWGFDFEDLI